jgi:uncharacterized membrane protein YbhN (UPF0104 family)
VTGYFVRLPSLLVKGSNVLVAVLAVFTALLAWAIFYKGHASETVKSSRWARVLRGIVDGVHSMGRSRSFLVSFILSFLYLALQVLPIWCLLRAYGLDLTMGGATVVLVILRLGTVVPQAPGNVGSFQALTVLGLRLLEVERGVATGFATLLFFVVTVPLYLAGFVALVATRMRLDDIHRVAHEEAAAHERRLDWEPGTEKPS